MRAGRKTRYRPGFDRLDGRCLMAAGAAAVTGREFLRMVADGEAARRVTVAVRRPFLAAARGAGAEDGVRPTGPLRRRFDLARPGIPDRSRGGPPARPLVGLPEPAGLPDGDAAQVVELINRERRAAGLEPMAVVDRLSEAAQIQADAMARLGQLDHVLEGAALSSLQDRVEHVGYDFRRLGENIASGYVDADAAVAGWIQSQGHRANILDPGFSETGVGVARDARGVPYFCQVFGRPG